jgi:putative oxidoreductase
MNLRPVLDKFDTAASCLQSPLLLIIRLYWGWQFFVTGRSHLMNLEKTTAFFTGLHIPMPKLNAIVAGSTECAGGLLLAAGFFARPAAVPLIFTMIIAYVTADNEALHAIASDPDKFVSAAPFLFLLAALIVLAFGPGKLSFDALFFRKSASGK